MLKTATLRKLPKDGKQGIPKQTVMSGYEGVGGKRGGIGGNLNYPVGEDQKLLERILNLGKGN